MSKKYEKLSKKELPDSQVEITGEISIFEIDEARKKTISNLKKESEMSGFRKGHVPENIIINKYGDLAILRDASYMALEEMLPEILGEYDLHIISSPEVSITKLAPGNPVEFKIIASLFPKFELTDYKKIASSINKKKELYEATPQEISEVELEIRKNHHHAQLHKVLGKESHDHPPIEEKDLPPLTDELVKEIGNFKNIDDFREKIKENLSEEKKARAKDKKRMEIIDAIISKTEINVPKVLVENEQNKMISQFKTDVERAGLTFERYLQSVKKTENEIREEWKDLAIKRAKSQLILSKISTEEKISPTKEKIEEESKKILEIYKDADPSSVKIYVALQLSNEKVFEFLENL